MLTGSKSDENQSLSVLLGRLDPARLLPLGDGPRDCRRHRSLARGKPMTAGRILLLIVGILFSAVFSVCVIVEGVAYQETADIFTHGVRE